jgi:ankyrin repeat protein
MLASHNYSTDGSIQVVELLIPVSNVNLQTKTGITALMLSTENDSNDNIITVIKLLITAGASIPYNGQRKHMILYNQALQQIFNEKNQRISDLISYNTFRTKGRTDLGHYIQQFI